MADERCRAGRKEAGSNEEAGPSSSSVETAVEVGRPLEEYEWLDRHPCTCGGAWDMESQHLVGQGENEIGTRMTDRLDVRCVACGRAARFFFVVQYEGRL